jgi:hypothetical protein
MHLAENAKAGHLCRKIHHVQQWVRIWDGDKVKTSVVACGRQLPSGFLTMWRDEAQGLSDLLMIPSRSSWSNSAFTTASFSATKQQNLAVMGRLSLTLI